MPSRIVSGGQTGADRAGLDFAISRGLEHGGYCPRGRRCEDGVIPVRYRLIETTTDDYKPRTKLNVKSSDATVIFNPEAKLSNGSALTMNYAEELGKPALVLRGFPITGQGARMDATCYLLLDFLARNRTATLNIAGNRESKASGITAYVVAVLGRSYDLAKELTPEALSAHLAKDDPYQGLDLFSGQQEASPVKVV